MTDPSWSDDAHDFMLIYGLDKELVLDVVRNPDREEMDPHSADVGYPIKKMRRGDIVVVVGYRDPDEPMILYVRLVNPDEPQYQKRSPRGASGSSLPPTRAELIRRIQFQGYQIDDSGRHTKVFNRAGKLMVTISKTPGSARSIADSWHQFQRAVREESSEQGSDERGAPDAR